MRRPQTIESAYLEHIKLMAQVHEHNMVLSSKGDHVFKNTWLCASTYFWNEFKRVIALDEEDERIALMNEIGKELKDNGSSGKFKEFHGLCFPEIPAGMLAATWICAGRAKTEIGLPILKLPPSKRRTMLWKGLELELVKLKTLWMVPIRDPGNN
jgi:hypothetical protein